MSQNNKFNKYFQNRVKLAHNLEHSYYNLSRFLKNFRIYKLSFTMIKNNNNKKIKKQKFNNLINQLIQKKKNRCGTV